MALSISKTKSLGGRPRTDAKPVLVRLPPKALSSLDTWIARQPEPRPSRPEAIRRLIEEALSRPGEQRQSDASLDRQIAEQETAIADMLEHSEPSPEAGMAIMDKAMAENDLTKLKNKRTRLRIMRRK